MPKGKLYIISAPSGAGKTSLVSKLLNQIEGLWVSISHTTRPQRPAEKDGVNYHFVTEQQFKDMIDHAAFLEYASVFTHYYGTSKEWVSQTLNQGTDVILEIDWQGAQQIKTLMPQAIGIFILPPSSQALSERLHRRGQDDKSVIQHRLKQAKNEISHYEEYSYLVVNDDFDQALHDLSRIIHSHRPSHNETAEDLTTPSQTQQLRGLLEDLLDK